MEIHFYVLYYVQLCITSVSNHSFNRHYRLKDQKILLHLQAFAWAFSDQ